MKSIFHHFQGTFIEANRTIFLEGESPTFMLHQAEIISSCGTTTICIVLYSEEQALLTS